MIMKPPYDLKTLVEKCRENYDELKDSSVIYEVERFLKNHPDPEEPIINTSIDTVGLKAITKIASRSQEDEVRQRLQFDYSADVLIAAYNYCIEGAKRIENGRCLKEAVPPNPNFVNKMNGHFYSHAASFADEAADRTLQDKKNLLLKANDCYTKSIEFGEKYDDDEYVRVQFAKKAYVSEKLSKITQGQEQTDWNLLTGHLFIDAAKRYEKAELNEQAAYFYSFGADKFFDAASATETSPPKKIPLFTDSIKYALKCTSLIETINLEHYAITSLNIGKFEEFFFKLTEEDEHRLEALHYYQIAGKYLNEHADENIELRTFVTRHVQKLQKAINGVKENTSHCQTFEKMPFKKPKKEKSSHFHKHINEELTDYFDE